jgi:hypothetical protein
MKTAQHALISSGFQDWMARAGLGKLFKLSLLTQIGVFQTIQMYSEMISNSLLSMTLRFTFASAFHFH